METITKNERIKKMIANLNQETEIETMHTENSIFNGELLTMAEAAALLKVTRKTLYAWKRTGRIRTVKVAGSLVRVPAGDLAALITR